ncbi:MAG: hypothetical protein KBF63_11220 [Rhodoferax sp.]|jgi:hypothetical protein|nr:hypothetical protein [Rhodoferax sp.]MBP9929835.1 hypothetical protein [Rhodoferax sp.]HQZ08070.1 hypothetical protein [Burkholderiaceae bacterium]
MPALPPKARNLLAILALPALTACASLHGSVASLPWKDAWGDRGTQVLARDHAMCEQLVEQRRSLLASCLASRGWTL